MDRLVPICKNFALTGTKKQAKQAVRCLYVNVFNQNENVFNDIIEVIGRFNFLFAFYQLTRPSLFTSYIFQRVKENLTPTSEHYLVSIVTLGHIAQNVPQRYMALIKNLISRKVMHAYLYYDYDCT